MNVPSASYIAPTLAEAREEGRQEIVDSLYVEAAKYGHLRRFVSFDQDLALRYSDLENAICFAISNITGTSFPEVRAAVAERVNRYDEDADQAAAEDEERGIDGQVENDTKARTIAHNVAGWVRAPRPSVTIQRLDRREPR